MERDQLIALVRKETGIKLSVADPVLAAAAINEVLLEDALAKMDRSIVTAMDRIAAMGVQSEASAKRVASGIINDAADWLEGRFKSAADQAAAGMLAQMQQETAKAEAASRVAVRAAWVVGGVGAAFASLAIGYGLAAL